MGGGLMQLVVIGPQDIYLTGNPEITFFKSVYKRYSNFAKECKTQTFNGSDTIANCILSRTGDLIQEIYLKISYKIKYETYKCNIEYNTNLSITIQNSSYILKIGDLIFFDEDIFNDTSIILEKYKTYHINNITSNNIIELEYYDEDNDLQIINFVSLNNRTNININIYKENINFINRDLTDLIDYVDIMIGEQRIDRHYSKWLDIYNELFEKNHNYRQALNKGNIHLNKNDELNIYIPLRFWFNKNVGLALPIIGLQYNDIKINLNMKDITDKINLIIIEKTLLVNYIYLDLDERRKFSLLNHEYLIEQIQYLEPEELKEERNYIELTTFNHPIKALFWTTEGNGYIKNVELQINGHNRFSELESDYFHLIQPYECFMGNDYKLSLYNKEEKKYKNRKWVNKIDKCTKNFPVGMYSFCLKPIDYQPSGTLNFSRLDSTRFKYIGKGSDIIHMFAINYNILRILNGMGGLVYSN